MNVPIRTYAQVPVTKNSPLYSLYEVNGFVPLVWRTNVNYLRGELVFYAMLQLLYSIINGSQFPQLEEQIVPRSEPATYL